MTFGLILLMKIILKKTKLQKYHWFYIGFFVFYAVISYLFLYQLTGLQPFQLNIHFFSNMVGSFSKRLIADAAPLALFLFLAYHSKTKWVQYLFIGLFAVVFSLNTLTVFHYFIFRANWQFGSIEFTSLLVLFTFITIALAIGFGYFAAKIKNGGNIWPAKRNVFVATLILLTLLSPLIPIRYSAHKTLVTTQNDVEIYFRIVHLERSGMTHLYQILSGTSQPIIVPDISVIGSFKEEIESTE